MATANIAEYLDLVPALLAHAAPRLLVDVMIAEADVSYTCNFKKPSIGDRQRVNR